MLAQGGIEEAGGVGVAAGVEGGGGDLCGDLRLHQVVDETVRLAWMLGAGRDHQVVDEQHRAFLRYLETYRLARLGRAQGVADPGHGQAEATAFEVGDVALAVDVAQVRSQSVQRLGGAAYLARRSTTEVAALVVEEDRQGFVRRVQQADAAAFQALALAGVEQQAPAVGQRPAIGGFGLRGIDGQAYGTP